MNRNVQRGQATRDEFVRVATALFAAQGYEKTSIEAVLKQTGASRGSLYHHFDGKEALFLAVLETLETDVSARLAAAADGITDPVGILRAECRAWIHLAGEPEIRQIVLTDAPAVLGRQRLREIDERYVLGSIRLVVAGVSRAGGLDEGHVETFARVIMAAVNEVAIMVAASPDPAATRPVAEAAFDEVLRRLLAA